MKPDPHQDSSLRYFTKPEIRKRSQKLLNEKNAIYKRSALRLASDLFTAHQSKEEEKQGLSLIHI